MASPPRGLWAAASARGAQFRALTLAHPRPCKLGLGPLLSLVLLPSRLCGLLSVTVGSPLQTTSTQLCSPKAPTHSTTHSSFIHPRFVPSGLLLWSLHPSEWFWLLG